MTGEEPAARAREALTDEEIIAKARAVSKELRGRHGDFDRFAGWLMDWMADQLEGRPAAPEAMATSRREAMARSDDEQAVADGMYPYFNREWGDKIRDALRQRSDTAQNTIASLLTDAYLCGVRDGSFGMHTLAREMARESDDQPR